MTDKKRLLISTDYGPGSDPDDGQSLVHLFLYLDEFQLVGLIASPPRGRADTIRRVIDCYAKDFPKLSGYPAPSQIIDTLRQGATKPGIGHHPTSGSRHIIDCAKAGPLYVLTWGACTDLCQAFHDAPEIKKNIYLFTTGSWNRDQDKKSYEWLQKNYSGVRCWVDSIHTNRGMYLGWNKSANQKFVREVRNCGEMGKYFYDISRSVSTGAYTAKMGDTPSLLFFLGDGFDDPGRDMWGGSYRRISKGHYGDRQHEKYAIGKYLGARTVSKHRKEFLADFKTRMERLK